ncbi:hypothetical protein ACWDRB_47150 [Nonomuraea sp. NPDC003707]
MIEIVKPRRVFEWHERHPYETVVIDRYDWLRCAAPCNNDPHSSGFEFLLNEPGLVELPEGTDLDGIYVCLACGKVIDIKDVPAWNPRSKEATNPRHSGQTSILTSAKPASPRRPPVAPAAAERRTIVRPVFRNDDVADEEPTETCEPDTSNDADN